jgi:hypothetical protein
MTRQTPAHPSGLLTYGPDDEGTHAFEGIEKFNESIMANFVDPVSQLAGIVRVGNRPTLGYQEASVELFLPGGTIAFRAGRIPSTTNDDFSSQGLTFEVDKPGDRLQITYRNSVARISTPSLLASDGRRLLKSSPSEECELDLTWEGGSSLFALADSGAGSVGESVVATDHYEQFGRMSGTVRLGTRTWVLDGVTGLRDHSWGPREWASYYGEFFSASFADGTRVSILREVDTDGRTSVTGRALVGGELRRVTDFEVISSYAGEATYSGRYQAVLHIEGAPLIPLDGTIRHFVPMKQATADRGVRMAQMIVSFVGPEGGWAYAEYMRPLPKA